VCTYCKALAKTDNRGVVLGGYLIQGSELLPVESKSPELKKLERDTDKLGKSKIEKRYKEQQQFENSRNQNNPTATTSSPVPPLKNILSNNPLLSGIFILLLD
jgi:hypothetical protein